MYRPRLCSMRLLYADVCKHHDRQFRTFHHLRKKFCTLSSLSYLPVPQPSQPLNLLPVRGALSALSVPCTWDHTAWPSGSDFSHSAECSQDSPTLQLISACPSFLWPSTVPCGHGPRSSHPFTSLDGRVHCFHFLALVINAAVIVCVQVFMWADVSGLLGVSSGVELLGHVVTLHFIAWETTRWLTSSHTIFPSHWRKGFHLLHILPNTCHYLTS